MARLEIVLFELLLHTRSRFLVNLLLWHAADAADDEVFEEAAAADTEVGTDADAVINEVIVVVASLAL